MITRFKYTYDWRDRINPRKIHIEVKVNGEFIRLKKSYTSPMTAERIRKAVRKVREPKYAHRL